MTLFFPCKIINGNQNQNDHFQGSLYITKISFLFSVLKEGIMSHQ